ncbi:MAG: grasp-with-spasm system SPASM domain peptide maturase, partial [Chryseobacterium sp.]
FIQIRFYETAKVDDLSLLMEHSKNLNFKSIDFILKFDPKETDIHRIESLIRSFPVISTIVVHSSPEDSIQNYMADSEVTYRNRIMHIKQQINSCSGCGIINLEGMFVPSLNSYIENSLHNSCLNKKISIDESGKIKNCPSMSKQFGDIKSTRLEQVVSDAEFLSVWDITKDKITICKDCEYRNICLDCRAYTKAPHDLYSKPSKCKYDPYSAEWN